MITRNIRKASWVVVALLLSVSAAGCSAELEGAPEGDGSSEEGLTGSVAVGTELVTTTVVNHRASPSTSAAILQVIPAGTKVRVGAAAPNAGWYGITWNGQTGWVFGQYLAASGTTPSNPSNPSNPSGSISSRGQDQMSRVVTYADRNHSGGSRGRCFQYVWGYLWKSGYGNIDSYNDAPDMGSAEARMFAEYMNRGNNAQTWGLQRLSLTNPYDAPRGAVVVVAAGSPGTAHPTAGDIAIAAGGGRFINDGPNMGYGGSRQAFVNGGGRVLGIYVPR
jgi:uncharacterized protein YraI